jgi:hypothetical protein
MKTLVKIIKLPFQITYGIIAILGLLCVLIVAAPFILLFWLMDIEN